MNNVRKSISEESSQVCNMNNLLLACNVRYCMPRLCKMWRTLAILTVIILPQGVSGVQSGPRGGGGMKCHCHEPIDVLRSRSDDSEAEGGDLADVCRAHNSYSTLE